MDLTPYVAALREDLTTAASAGDENTRRAAAVLAAALEPAARLAIMNALSDLAAEVTASLDDHVIDVRLDGRDVQVVVTGTRSARETPRADEQSTPPPGGDTADMTGDMSRMTLRLFEQLKSKAEQAAASQGVSLNTFVQQAVQGALHGKGKHRGQDWSQRWGGEWPGENRGDSSSRVHGWYEG
ncbi:HicB family protein [Actinophytocola xinjiangensis]|uniref:HicB family protein n=1 Tax=Actinophytocola xinjiangensis TaxID=485602 RepID=A0A7Z1AUT0_9PSEU|nr:toxin-antitoxin system HicB family antitoxin [Actinophytocola xinjiangensis]OLF05474.1 HicB family protein [Actinophytocola xinjiangensis]